MKDQGVIKTELIWHEKTEKPDKNKRCLVYSSQYKNRDATMVFRILDSQFIRICSDVSLWAYLETPK
ncbi:MAG TPA: hypothetical protein ENH60_12445 [Pricia sp.]|nr:hypothetical protein [Pricia sp.]